MAKTAIVAASATIIESIPIRRDAQGRYSLNDLHRAAMMAGKATESQRPGEFLRSDGVRRFIAAFDARSTDMQNCTSTDAGKAASVDARKIASVNSVKGGKNQGTYAAELVAIRYAAWIDADFEVGVYLTFQAAAQKSDDWRTLRHASASTNKVVNAILQHTRADAGKDTQHFHYANEAKLVNWVVCGEFKGLNRNELGDSDLDLIAHLEERNAVLLGRGLTREQRQPMLKQYAMDWRMKRDLLLPKS